MLSLYRLSFAVMCAAVIAGASVLGTLNSAVAEPTMNVPVVPSLVKDSAGLASPAPPDMSEVHVAPVPSAAGAAMVLLTSMLLAHRLRKRRLG